MKKQTIKVDVVAGVVIKKDGKYLFIQEKKASAYGLWNLPAGRVDEGEDFATAAIREAKEETGFDIKLKGEIGIFHEDIAQPVKHAFEGEIIGGALNIPPDEILDARWFTLEELSQMQDKLRGTWGLAAVKIIEGR